MTPDKLIVYATTNDGEGFVTKVGEFDSIEDVSIRTGLYSKDVVITFAVKADSQVLEHVPLFLQINRSV